MSIVTSLHGAPGNFGGTTGYTRAMAVKFNKQVNLSRIGHYANPSYENNSGTVISRVWDASKNLIASGTSTTGTLNTSVPLWSNFASEITLEANTTYYIGGYQSTATGYYSQGSAHAETTVDGITMTSKSSDTVIYYTSGDNANAFIGSSTSSYEFPYALDVTDDAIPVVSVTNPVASHRHDPREPLTVSWTYSDADGDVQTGYSILANGVEVAAGTGAGTSAVILANTLADETDYTITVTTTNAKGSGSGSVNIRSDSWVTGDEVTSSTQSGLWTPNATDPGGNYEIQVATADGNGLGPWSESVTKDNVLPFNTAPDAVITNISDKVYNNDDIALEWVYSDNENDPQVSYQIRYRKKI